MGSENVSYAVAFVAGFLTYLSPCLLPILPAFVAYITGISSADFKDLEKRGEVRRKTIMHSLLFILGFSIIFVLLGLTATFVGKSLFRYQKEIRIFGGALIIVFGLQLTGILRFNFLEKDLRLRLTTKGASYIGSFLVGVTFAAAWSPCAGPILGSILVLAGTKASVAQGASLLTAYSLGIALPFFITALLANSFLEYFNRFKKFLSAVTIVAGIFLIIVGILLATNYLTILSGKFLMRFTR